MFCLLYLAAVTWSLAHADSYADLTELKPQGDIEARLFSGSNASNGQFPFVVYIEYSESEEESFVCTGSLIHVKYVLTAAYCTTNDTRDYEAAHYGVVVGTSLVTNLSRVHDVSRVYTHPNFSSSLHTFDLGVLKLGRPVVLSDDVGLVRLVQYRADRTVNELNKEHYKCAAMGFGVTHENPVLAKPSALRYAVTYVVEPRYCHVFAEGFKMYFEDVSVCTYYPETRSTCRGDYGGPLVCEGVQVGVSSPMKTPPDENCTFDSPSSFTRVDLACPFLAEVMAEDVTITCSPAAKTAHYLSLVLLSQILLY